MSVRRYAGVSRVLLALSAVALVVSACATAPSTPKGAAGSRDPGYGRMAPIPNPTGPNPTGEAARPAAARPVPRQPRVAAPGKTPPPAAKPPAPPTPVSGGDPAKARVLRAQGLEALNKGAIDKAQDLLRQALRLDPGNALIQRDLDRANRIGQAVRAKP
jgi:hypothetical protein